MGFRIFDAAPVTTPDQVRGMLSAENVLMGSPAMTDTTIELDQRRGMAAQKATELRRLLLEVEANEHELRRRHEELELHLLAAPAANWHDAAEKASYLLALFSSSAVAQDPRRQKLIAAVLDDFKRLLVEHGNL